MGRVVVNRIRDKSTLGPKVSADPNGNRAQRRAWAKLMKGQAEHDSRNGEAQDPVG